MVTVSIHMLTLFAILGTLYAIRSKTCVSGDLIVNIPRTLRVVKSASTNPSWCQLLLMYYISTTTNGFHYTSPSEKPSTTGSVQVVCASSQWDAYLITYSERKFTRDYLWKGHLGTLPWRYTAQGPPITRYCCLQGVVAPSRRSSSAVFTELSLSQLSNTSTTVSAL